MLARPADQHWPDWQQAAADGDAGAAEDTAADVAAAVGGGAAAAEADRRQPCQTRFHPSVRWRNAADAAVVVVAADAHDGADGGDGWRIVVSALAAD